MLTFDEATHTYTLAGRVLPSVTQVLKPLVDYSHIPPAVLETARQQGIAVHRMVEADCKGSLIDLPDWMVGYFEAWEKFKAETGFEFWESEQRVFSAGLGCAGTLDLTGVMKKVKKPSPGIIDVKRSFYAGAAIGLQLAGYETLRNPAAPKDRKTALRHALQLKADGNYRLKSFEDRTDHGAFLACLTMHKWKEVHDVSGT